MTKYKVDIGISVDEFAALLVRSGLAERRPVDDRSCLQGMLDEADLLVTAWRGEQLVGVARSVTDFSYCCYLSDLAVDRTYQRRGIGRELVQRTRDQLGPQCMVILLAAPAAVEYYPRIGFQRHESAWILRPDTNLK